MTLFPRFLYSFHMSLMWARVVFKTNLIRSTGVNRVNIVVHFSSVKYWENNYSENKAYPRIRNLKEWIDWTSCYHFFILKQFVGILWNTMHLFTVILFFHLSFTVYALQFSTCGLALCYYSYVKISRCCVISRDQSEVVNK